jgi:hypothetical protein
LGRSKVAQLCTPDFEGLRWFPLPSDVAAELRGEPTGTHASLLYP